MPENEGSDTKSNDAATGAAFASASRSLGSVRAAREGMERITRTALQWRNASPEQLGGRIAEEWHATTFNIDAASKGASLRATTSAANGQATAVADVVISEAGRTVAQVQVKYHGSPARTTFAVSRAEYDGMQRLVPSDQVQKVRGLARQRGADTLGNRNYAEVANGATDRINLQGVESQSLSRTEAIAAAKNPAGAGAMLVKGQIARAAKNGAVVGAVVGGGVAAIMNAVACARGKKSGKQAVVDTVKDAASGAATGAAVSGAAVVAEATLVRLGASAASGGAAPVAIGLTVVEVGKDVGRAIKGDIDGELFVNRTGKNVVKGTITWGGMKGGAAVGTAIFPGPGTVIGGVVGGVAGALCGGWLAK
jgi:hypothetical protein